MKKRCASGLGLILLLSDSFLLCMHVCVVAFLAGYQAPYVCYLRRVVREYLLVCWVGVLCFSLVWFCYVCCRFGLGCK
ncbi:hypothetical protein BO85DRAFT_280624 [Aspergillus piperis CBS 112811]|uniref:Uncharacterized protein n=1 Tax=Aspergillus piperis CBS 112811 TaxID=1448313 RepID=A0A8G1R2A5_9EURO|nr:hypothetical protein BO85DRAFT_280624 [Aspergillus piperis CBS 112811]RAH58721.1 hypothetical protein BO85DRAFT_280624 [Aspergillus piperis CBS 112811]